MIYEARKTNVEVVEGQETKTNILIKPLLNVDSGLLLLRLVLGATFVAHGSQKVLGWFGGPGLDGFVGWMASMGVPAAFAYLAAFTEFFGGLALLAGLLARPAAPGITFVMLTAIFKVHLAAGFFAPNGFEFPLALAAMAVTVFILGPGKYSVDDKLFNK